MSAHQLFIHLAWTTLDRRPMIDAATRSFLEEFLQEDRIGRSITLMKRSSAVL